MKFHTRKWVKPEDLNPNGTLFGGRLLSWIDEEAALFTIIQLENTKVVTKRISQVDFKNSAREGDIIEIGIEVVKFGMASLTLACEVRNKMTQETILTISSIVMANLDDKGKPKAHGKTEMEYVTDRLKNK
ncbi:acyl-CoA thioesterase [Aureibaculum algae]|uniref:Acyl-CoA thioesterase n=1 Tax=Aureibaculum algae TaxID=2584122 RepID=A0A5B7TTU9_9FLAO|nr:MULTISPECIES: hotdog domain-containing protein [Aureibaculum]QCX38526.1 acyl-CoA thioesterase [Aureibaculum algae]